MFQLRYNKNEYTNTIDDVVLIENYKVCFKKLWASITIDTKG